MVGNYRKASRHESSAAKPRWTPSWAAAAVSFTSLTTALITGTTVTVSPPVELAATITPASSTAQIIATPSFYGIDYTDAYGGQQIVPFFLGPQGIVSAIQANVDDPDGNAVLSSGWGAGQTATALGILQASGDPALDSIELVILDNNTNRAGGGFWTTYWMFAPLLFTSSAATPDNLDVPVLDVGYEYNINGNAPTYPLNLLALINSLVAYLYGYAGQSAVQLPAPVDAVLLDHPENLERGIHYVVAPDGTYTTYPATGDVTYGNITYVTYESDRLPLVKPLLLIPGGFLVADAIEPVLTVLVNWGYQDNQPIPDDPGQLRPVGLFPTVSETITALTALPGAVQEGLSNLQSDVAPSTTTSTNTVESYADTTTFNTTASSDPHLAAQRPKLTDSSTPSRDNQKKFTSAADVNEPDDASPSGTAKPFRHEVAGVKSRDELRTDRLTPGADDRSKRGAQASVSAADSDGPAARRGTANTGTPSRKSTNSGSSSPSS